MVLAFCFAHARIYAACLQYDFHFLQAWGDPGQLYFRDTEGAHDEKAE